MMSELIVGIDLGTTNSEIAVVRQGRVEVIFVTPDSFMLPSVVGLDPANQLLVGDAARNQYMLHPERTIRSVKRQMGNEVRLNLGVDAFTPQEISAMILRRLKSVAEAYLGQAVKKAVITVPAFFSDAQRRATHEAGEIAGLEVVRIINEPTAAALAYGEANSPLKKNNGESLQNRVLVYDLGGGTFDVSVVLIEGDVVEVLASHGNNHLGGDDFDSKIVDFLVRHLETQGITTVRSSISAMARLQRAAESAKIILSNEPFVTISEEYLLEHQGKPVHLNLEFSRQEYEDLIAPYIDETMEAIQTALKEAGLSVRHIDRVLLVGGASRTPCITERLKYQLGMDVHAEVNPDLCVAMGAALQGSIISGDHRATVLVDVTPYTFGTSSLVPGTFSETCYVPIIHKNTPIPVTKTSVFYTILDQQKEVEIDIYQGDSVYLNENLKIGDFIVNGLSNRPSGNEILINLTLDLNGILKVTATEKRTGLQKSITINNAMKAADAGELAKVRQRIDELSGDADRSQRHTPESELTDADPALQRLKTEVQELMEKAERMLPEIAAEDAEEMRRMIQALKEHLVLNATALLQPLMHELADMIYYLQRN